MGSPREFTGQDTRERKATKRKNSVDLQVSHWIPKYSPKYSLLKCVRDLPRPGKGLPKRTRKTAWSTGPSVVLVSNIQTLDS